MTATRIGIDVSKWQKVIDWKQVKQDPKAIQFAYVRSHYGLRQDPKATEHILGAREVGLDVGVYQYFKANEDHSEQWWVFQDFIASMHNRGVELHLPPVLDLEVDALWNRCDPEDIITSSESWLEATKELFGGAMIYTNQSSCLPFLAFDYWPAIARETPLWAAHWGATKPTLPFGFTSYRMHQYTCHGTVHGIYGSVDLNVEILPEASQ
jgi:GH25 family lysozyme M1 (1,4-beta-N-acetylmuramidase)